ncbi:hypothetical protein ZIOFF_018064 [Zingiber officinale]|uniref:dUTP diphosphatase n=1 Tax=Zingiber officinale TaxID=94328 RepID=A0A8J5H7Q2_ZINOF|nr:hypothetical protein ZIOFF_018064 [Zingiber officinale]
MGGEASSNKSTGGRRCTVSLGSNKGAGVRVGGAAILLAGAIDGWRWQAAPLRAGGCDEKGLRPLFLGVVDYLTTHGVKALPGRSLSTQKLQGLNWVIKPTQVIIFMQPSEVSSNNLMDGRIYLSFNNYIVAQSAEQVIYNKRDEETQSQNGEIVAVLIERENGVFEEIDIPTNPDIEETDYPYLLVHKLSSNAIIPIRQSTGATGLDLTTSEDYVIPPRGRGLIPIGISLEIPWGTYGRIAARSSAAYRLDLDIGARVIDCDYNGEVKILAFNHSNQIIRIYKGECVSQIIIEYIAITDVYEVQSLTLTDRGTKGFGSTSTPPIFKKLLPKESAAVLLQVENELPKPTLEQDHARETSPGVTILQPMDTTLEYADGDFLEHIQYLAYISTPWDLQPKWDSYDSDNPWINPFTTEGDG